MFNSMKYVAISFFSIYRLPFCKAINSDTVFGNGDHMMKKVREKRVHKTLIVQYHRHGDKESGCELTQVKEISTRGMSFNSMHCYDKKDLLDISIKLPAFTESVHVIGEIVRCDDLVEGYELGKVCSVRFVEITPKIKSELAQTVDFFWGKMAMEKGVVNKNSAKHGRAKRAAIGLFFRYRRINSNMIPKLNYSINMSTSGLLFQTEFPLPINDKVELEFKFNLIVYGEREFCLK